MAGATPVLEKKLSSSSLSFGKHGRNVSLGYDDMKQLGLSKAIDEYHKLLQAGPGNSSQGKAPPREIASSTSRFIKATICRPLPLLLRPETLIAILNTLWTMAAYILHHTAVVTIPAAVWFLFASAAPLPLPADLLHRLPASLDSVLKQAQQFQTPREWTHRAVMVGAFLIIMHMASRTLASRALARWERASKRVTQDAIQAVYYKNTNVQVGGGIDGGVRKDDRQRFIAGVKALASQVGSEGGVLPAVVADRFEECAAWLERAGIEVGVAVPAAAKSDPSAALVALKDVQQATLGHPLA